MICVIATVFGVCVYSNDNAISESEMESLIVESFEFFLILSFILTTLLMKMHHLLPLVLINTIPE